MCSRLKYANLQNVHSGFHPLRVLLQEPRRFSQLVLAGVDVDVGADAIVHRRQLTTQVVVFGQKPTVLLFEVVDQLIK